MANPIDLIRTAEQHRVRPPRCALFLVALGVAMTLFGTQVYGGEQPVEEVFQSELVYPQEKGELQFTLVPQVRKGGDRTRWIGELVLEYGLTDALQVELEWPAFQRVDPEDGESTAGTGDLELGLKYSWMNMAETGFHSAVGVGLGLPTGDQERGLGEGKTGVEPFVALAWDPARLEDFQIFLHTGLEIEKEGKEGFVNAGLFARAGAWVVTAELNWAEEESYFTPGLVAHPRDGWEIGLGVPIGLNDESDDFRVLFMVTWEMQL